jgi:hypothetical protein
MGASDCAGPPIPVVEATDNRPAQRRRVYFLMERKAWRIGAFEKN